MQMTSNFVAMATWKEVKYTLFLTVWIKITNIMKMIKIIRFGATAWKPPQKHSRYMLIHVIPVSIVNTEYLLC